jgi:hypothetical protein
MNEPVPVRAIEAQRVTRSGEVIETVRVVEYTTPTPAPVEVRELPRGYDPERDSPAAGGVLHYHPPAPVPAALPPGRPPRRWWWGWWR